MKKNMGTADRAIRAGLGLVMLSMVLFLDPAVRWWGLVGLVPLGTALIGWCPAYLPFGLSTCKVDKKGA